MRCINCHEPYYLCRCCESVNQWPARTPSREREGLAWWKALLFFAAALLFAWGVRACQ